MSPEDDSRSVRRLSPSALRSRWTHLKPWQKWTAGVIAAVVVLLAIGVVFGDDTSDKGAGPSEASGADSSMVSSEPVTVATEPDAPSPAELVASGKASEWDGISLDSKEAVAERFLAVSGFSPSSAPRLVEAMDASSARDGLLRDVLRRLAGPITRAEAQEQARAEARKKTQARAVARARAAARARERARRERLLRGTLIEGAGARVVTVNASADGPFVVEASHRGSSNFQIELVGNGVHELLVNEIGSYSGTVLAQDVPSGRYRMAVEADGTWSLRFRQPRPMGGEPGLLRTFRGSGSQVLAVQSAQDLEPIVTAGHTGNSNFQVQLVAYGDEVSGSELLFNEIGSYRGQALATVPSGDYLLSVVADGSWTVRFQR